jgi:mono/diheme cytochrome c family protein
MVGDPSLQVIAQIVLTASRVDNQESRDLIAKCVAKHPMSERVFQAVAAAAPRAHLVDYLAIVQSHPAFQKEPLGEDARAQLNRWQQVCAAGTVSSGNAKAVERLLSLIAASEPSATGSLLRAIPSPGKPKHNGKERNKPVVFEAKPHGLTRLEQRTEPEIREELKRIAPRFTWPGLPSYARHAKPQVPSLTKAERALFEKGQAIYRELCISCHGGDGRGLKSPEGKGLLAPPLPGSPRLEQNKQAAIQIMLHGMIGDLDGKKYEGGLMAPFGAANDDEWVASVLTYVRREWGNSGAVVQPSDVAAVRERFKDRKLPWTQPELDWKLRGESAK